MKSAKKPLRTEITSTRLPAPIPTAPVLLSARGIPIIEDAKHVPPSQGGTQGGKTPLATRFPAVNPFTGLRYNGASFPSIDVSGAGGGHHPAIGLGSRVVHLFVRV